MNSYRRSSQRRSTAIVCATVALVCGCTGNILGDPGQLGGDAGPGLQTTGGASVAGAAAGGGSSGVPNVALPTAPLRRLTSFEYNNAVREVLGTSLRPADAFVAQTRDGVFDNDVSNLSVPATLVEEYIQAAELLVAEALSEAHLQQLTNCSAMALTRDCAEHALSSIAERAYRRPLSSSEAADLAAVFAEGLAAGEVKTGLEYGLGRLLISPNFLYWVELGAEGAEPLPNGRLALTPYEVASRISRLTVGSIPDKALFEAARMATLGTSSQRADQAKRLLRSTDGVPTEAAKSNLARFHAGWLGLDALDTMVKGLPSWNAELAVALRTDTQKFLDDLVWNRADAADIYRGGLLTQPSIMALTSNDNPKPMKRAAFVLGRILCSPPPPPPPNAPLAVPEGTPGNTERERFEHLTSVAPCNACHTALNGIGWTFSGYDALGAPRALDALDQPVDVHGTLVGSDVDGPIANVDELAARIARSQTAERCLVRQWFRFENGRFETDADAETIAALLQSFDVSGRRVEDLVIAMVQADDFASRPPQ